MPKKHPTLLMMNFILHSKHVQLNKGDLEGLWIFGRVVDIGMFSVCCTVSLFDSDG